MKIVNYSSRVTTEMSIMCRYFIIIIIVVIVHNIFHSSHRYQYDFDFNLNLK